MQTIESLKKNEFASESELIIYADGPKDENDPKKTQDVRDYIHSIQGFKDIHIIERNENWGLAKSIITGVTEVVNEFGRIIVLEDDLVSSPYFLRFMNEALEIFESDVKVISITAYIYKVDRKLPKTFFLRGADCWGWATWRRGWAVFEEDGNKLLHALKARNLTKEFDFNGATFYTRMLRNQVTGENASWAVRWYASAFLRGLLTLYPGVPLVQNIGNDRSGTHCGSTNHFKVEASKHPIPVEPIPIEEDTFARKLVEDFLRTIKPSLMKRGKNYIVRKLSAFQ